MNIAFVLTNYNNSDLTRNAVKSILDQPHSSCKVVIVDNASDDKNKGILIDLSNEFRNIKVIFNSENSGYFCGLNIGIIWLKENFNQFEYVVIGNNDVLFSYNFIKSIENSTDLFKKYPVISPDIKTVDGFHQNPHVIKSISRVREVVYDIYHYNYYISKIVLIISRLTKSFSSRGDERQYKYAQEVYQGYGAMYILGPLFFENFEKLWAPTFLMYEEFFLSKQLSDKGFKIYYEPSIKLTHLMHASTDMLPSRQKWEFSRTSHNMYRKFVSTFKPF
jgi:GT2 family glycosyltransferase